jgi:hypothetical protein
MTYTVTPGPMVMPDRKRASNGYANVEVKKYVNKRYNLKPFVAWDGEGYTDDHGEHHTMLWGCSTGQHIKGTSLTGNECFDLLLDVAKQRKAIHVIFSGGYDMVMMLRHYPKTIAQRVLEGKVTWWNGYRLEYFKGKFLKLSDGTRSTILYDVFTFFSTSFVRACREYMGDDPDFDRIESTKLLRDSFTEETLETLVIPYWQQELSYLVKLCNVLRQRLHEADIFPSQWHGPGAVASAVLKAKGIKAHMAVTPDEVKEGARHAYFGGRFEQFQIGYRDSIQGGPIYQYDIRSAYPDAIRRLPSLANLQWVNRRRYKDRYNTYGLYNVTYHSGPNVTLDRPGPLPWRSARGAIYYPHDIASGWYWGVELAAVAKHLNGTLTVNDSWEPSSDPTNFPFQWIATMYDERAKMKAAGNPTQLALKLAMNSIYGKLAQSKGASVDPATMLWKLPTYHQLEWAGWITASCRAKLYDAMVQAGSSLIAVETDAVYCTKKLDLPCSSKLGDWEEEQTNAIMYVQSGVYFKQDSVGSWKLKSRGFEPRNHTFESWRNVMARLPADSEAVVTLKLRRFGGLPSSSHWARWYEMERTSVILQATSKRVHNPIECVWCDRNTTMVEHMHTLIVPQYGIAADIEPSSPHSLPWVERNALSWPDEWVISEEGYETFLGVVQ